MQTPIQHAEHPHGGPTDPSHDERLKRGIIDTQVSRSVAWALLAGMLLLIFGVPISQAVIEKRNDEDSMLLDVFKHLPTKESCQRYEDDLKNASYAKDWVQPRVQERLSRLRAGNDNAVIGQGDWLYYSPGLRSVVGPGFLDANINQSRIKAALDANDEPLHPDPRPAVLEFYRALQARGIALVLFPVPDKVSLQPFELSSRRASPVVARNVDYARFVAQMRAAGVLIFDPTPDALVPGEPARFLTQDTHWTPAWMHTVAGRLATFVHAHVSLAEASPRPAWRLAPRSVTRVGDIVDMLKLPEAQRTFHPHTITVQQVWDAKGELWQPSEEADVLLLGDSFSNVFSAAPMGWGEAAGLPQHLALALGRELDVIAQNDSGAMATRQTLSRALVNGEDRLKGKRVVIWEFASRELAVGDWKPMSYALPAASK